MDNKSKVRVETREYMEHVLDVTLSIDEQTFYIYDLSSYFRFSDERDQRRYRSRFRYAIAGTRHTVNIICDRKELTYAYALQIAINYIEESLTVHRLD